MAEMTVLIEEDIRVILHGVVDNDNPKSRSLPFRQRPDGRLMGYNLNTGITPSGAEEEIALEEDGAQREQVILWDYTGGAQIRAAGEPATGQAMVSLFGRNVSGNLQAVENEDTGELRVVNMGWDGAAPIRLLAEGTGELRTSLMGWNGAAMARVLLETNGEQRMSLYGQDEALNMDSLRTDPNRILWRRDYPAYVQIDPVEIPAADGILWNPGATAAELYEVSFLVVNNDAGAAAVTVSVGVDIAAGGGLAAPEYWIHNVVINHPGNTGWQGPFIIAGDDDVRGVASAANDASIHFRVKRVDTGA